MQVDDKAHEIDQIRWFVNGSVYGSNWIAIVCDIG